MSNVKYNGKVVYIRATFDEESTMVLVSFKKDGPMFKVDVSELTGYTIKK